MTTATDDNEGDRETGVHIQQSSDRPTGHAPRGTTGTVSGADTEGGCGGGGEAKAGRRGERMTKYRNNPDVIQSDIRERSNTHSTLELRGQRGTMVQAVMGVRLRCAPPFIRRTAGAASPG